jgi:hypothetical protein
VVVAEGVALHRGRHTEGAVGADVVAGGVLEIVIFRHRIFFCILQSCRRKGVRSCCLQSSRDKGVRSQSCRNRGLTDGVEDGAPDGGGEPHTLENKKRTKG